MSYPTPRSVRNIPVESWDRLRVQAAREKATLGALLTKAISEYLERNGE